MTDTSSDINQSETSTSTWALHALPMKTVYVSDTVAAAIRQYNNDVGVEPLHIHHSSISRWLHTDPERRRATTKGGVVVYRWQGTPAFNGGTQQHRVVRV